MVLNRHARRRAAALGQKPHATNSTNARLRGASLFTGSLAASALMLAAPQAAFAQVVAPFINGPCVLSSTTVTCTGDVSAGVKVEDPYVTLNVNKLNQAITPATGIDGINFRRSSGYVTITVDTGDYGITTNGASGIFGHVNGNGNVSINNTGDVTTYGIGAVGISGEVVGTGSVTIYNEGNITTAGLFAVGILGYAHGYGDVLIDSTGDIKTLGVNAHGIHGRVKLDGNVTIYSSGDISTGDITTANGITTTTGEFARGIFGKVGGDGDVTITSEGDVTTYGESADGIRGDVDGNGNGNVTIYSIGDITTKGDDAHGIYGRVRGDGDVTITSEGDIKTDGDNAKGIKGTVRNGISGNEVTIKSTGKITTKGRFADGISGYISGDGDVTIDSEGTIKTTGYGVKNLDGSIFGDGNVTITSTGDIIATGSRSLGINAAVAESGTSTINLVSGTIQGGTGSGAGVSFYGLGGGDVTNVLNVFGDVTISALSGTAVEAENGDTTIKNWGVLNTVSDGDILLGDGDNGFNNYASATFKSGEIVSLGAGNLFSNEGTFSPGGDDNVLTTELTGQLNQSSTGILLTDVDMTANTADLLNVTETATLTGNVQVLIKNLALGPTQNTILSAAGGTTNNGLGLIASPILQAELTYPNDNDVVLSTDLEFTAPGTDLNPNQTGIADTIDSALGAGGGALGSAILALINGPTSAEEYQWALDQLGGEVFLNEDNAALFGAESFDGQLFSCQVNGEQYAAISEGSCLWVRPINGRSFVRDGTATSVGFSDEVFGASFGSQTEFKPDWFVGAAFGFENGDLINDTGAISERQSFNGGLSLKRTLGAFAVSGALYGSTSDYDTTRDFTFGGLTASNNASHNVNVIGARIRGAYLHEFGGGSYVKPLVDFSVNYLDREGFTETGTAATALTIAGASGTYLSATPAIEFGIDQKVSDKQIVRFYGKAGVSIYSDYEHSLSGTFANAPAGTAGFDSSTEFDQYFAEVEAGFTFMDDGAATIQLAFQGRYSENSTQSGGFIKANMEF